ncbi:hypothetical protein BGX26_004797, partial [Mortierella sp. AD094]
MKSGVPDTDIQSFLSFMHQNREMLDKHYSGLFCHRRSIWDMKKARDAEDRIAINVILNMVNHDKTGRPINPDRVLWVAGLSDFGPKSGLSSLHGTFRKKSDYSAATIIVLATNDSFADRNAAFGPRIAPEGIILSLIAVESLDAEQETTACRPVTGAPANTSWAALVERGGDCSFIEKVRHMQASGAKAVVVGDNQNSGLITMYAR